MYGENEAYCKLAEYGKKNAPAPWQTARLRATGGLVRQPIDGNWPECDRQAARRGAGFVSMLG